MFNQKSEFEKHREALRKEMKGLRIESDLLGEDLTATEYYQALTFFLSLADKIDD